MLRCADFNSRVACYYGALAFSCLFLLLAAARASTEFDVPPGAEAKPTSIVAGPDGNLWVFESGRQSIARMTPTGQLTEFSIPAGVTVGRMIAGPDGLAERKGSKRFAEDASAWLSISMPHISRRGSRGSRM